MTLVAAACSLCTAVIAFILLRRLFTASRDGRARIGAATCRDDFPSRIASLIHASLDESLLAEAGAGGLAEVEVRLREQRDPYRTAAELIDWLARESSQTAYTELCGIVKGVYQLGHALRASDAAVRDCLEPLLARLRAANSGGVAIARVECIQPGAILDPTTMAPLNYGARVKQPLGVLAYDAAGKVLGKAKVLCS
jgi:hypothetical protein